MSDHNFFPQSQDGIYCSNSGPPPPQYTPEQVQQLLSIIPPHMRQTQQYCQPQQILQQRGSLLPPLHPTHQPLQAPANPAPPQQPVSESSQHSDTQQSDSQHSEAAAGKGKRPRRKSRSFTEKENAQVAVAYMEYKHIIDKEVKNGADLKAAWLKVQERSYELALELRKDFPDLDQIKAKVKWLKAQYTSTVERMTQSGGSRPTFADTTAFKIFEGSGLARDPLVRHEGLLDSDRPEGKIWQLAAPMGELMADTCMHFMDWHVMMKVMARDAGANGVLSTWALHHMRLLQRSSHCICLMTRCLCILSLHNRR